MTSRELKRWLDKRGCRFEPGKGGHLVVRLGDKVTSLPMHGAGYDVPSWLVRKIKQDLGLA